MNAKGIILNQPAFYRLAGDFNTLFFYKSVKLIFEFVKV